jgi:non-specific serine/threonine protein kinase/serine/threonine-protein kinase
MTRPHAPNHDWDLVKTIAGEAFDLPDDQRADFIARRCAQRQDLLDQVRDLIGVARTRTSILDAGGIPADMLAAALDIAPVVEGSRIGRYVLGPALGSGGMGTVHQAFDTSLSRTVALKFLSHGVASPRARRRFETEARSLARLDHPAIARIFEAGVHVAEGSPVSVPFIAMEFVPEARTLDAWMREHRPSLRDTLAMFAAICDAVHHGHQQGVLHLDLKPSNILVGKDNAPKIIDFGVARLRSDADAATIAAVTATRPDLGGTPAYMPPEAFDGASPSLDTRADIFALGAIMYELLAGIHPRETPSLSMQEAAAFVRDRVPAPLAGRRRDCKGDIDTVVHAALDPDRAKRYQSAAELAADLRRILEHRPIVARPVSFARHIALFARRRKAIAAATVIAALGLGAGFVALQTGLSRARASEAVARDEADRARRSSQFIMGLLRAADPFAGESPLTAAPDWSGWNNPWPPVGEPDKAPSIGDLLAAGVDRLEVAFPGDLQMQADMAVTLAETAEALADRRADKMLQRAADALSAVHGPDHPRTLVARHRFHAWQMLRGTPIPIETLETHVATIRAVAADNRPLLNSAAALCMQSMVSAGRRDDALALAASVRADLARGNDDDPLLLAADVTTLDYTISKPQQAAAALDRIPDLLARAKQLDAGAGLNTLNVLFHQQRWQREVGRFAEAAATIRRGAELATRVHGNRNKGMYEWWSELYFVALLLKDYPLAEEAARSQVAVAQGMLGPRSMYTTKANGRLSRALLSQGVRLEEAQRAARQAVDGAPELLEAGDAWAIFHESLWAWSIRLQGDWAKALDILRHRMAVETAAGRPAAVDWAELVRWAELAQGEMDGALARGDWTSRESDIRMAVERAELHASRMSPDWPTVTLVEAARARFETERAKPR